MRERITFLHRPDDALDPKQLQLQNDTLHVTFLKAAREDKLIVGLYELPQELWRALKQCYELHIRWISPNPYLSVAPFVSTASPGLHVFFTPQRDKSADLLCPLLSKTFGARVDCRTPEDTFIHLPVASKRFASSAAFQHYQTLPSLTDLATYLHQRICPEEDESCRRRAASLKSADYLDIDYDTLSQSLVLSAFWHSPPLTEAWNERIDKSKASDKVEIGVLASEKPAQPEELSLAGFLAVVGEDSKPNPTLFSFPSRHHVAPSTSGTEYSTAFLEPIGLHPTLRLTLSSSTDPPTDGCALHTYLTLPSSLFLDKYQLSSSNFLASKNLHSIRSLAGETDLEAPIWTVSKWGSTLLLELAPPPSTSGLRSAGTVKEPGGSWHADVPLHLRYLPPNREGHAFVSVAWPIVFWACPSDEGTKMSTNPFDRVNLGYDGLFGPRTMFYHLQPASGGESLLEEILVPVLDMEGSKMKWVQSGTVTTVVLGFLWVCLKLLAVNRGSLGRKGGRWKGD